MTSPTPMDAPPSPNVTRKKPENLWLNLLFNAVLPAVVLSVGSKERYLGLVWGLVVALSFPLSYALYDLWYRRTWNLLSIIGFGGTLLTGGLGLMKVGGLGFAIKEAAVPLIVGLAIPLSLKTRQPLVRTLLYNDQLLNTTRIAAALEARQQAAAFERLLVWASWVMTASFALSAVTNFLLALWLLPAVAGTEEFSQQLGKLQFWSWPGTVLPSSLILFYALYRLLNGLEELTGLTGEELMHPKRST